MQIYIVSFISSVTRGLIISMITLIAVSAIEMEEQEFQKERNVHKSH